MFPSNRLSRDSCTDQVRRSHREPSGLQKAVTQVARTAGLLKHVTCQTFCHSFAAHLLEDGYDIRTVQELLGQKNVETTMHYMHTVKKMCSHCGNINAELTLTDRTYVCKRCGMRKNRDLNAAINLNKVGRAHPEPTDACGHDGSVSVVE